MNWTRSSIFTQERSHEGENHGFIYIHEQNTICSQSQLDDIAHEQTIICGKARDHNRTGFVDHMVGSQPIKRKKNLQSNDNNNYPGRIAFWRFFSLLDPGVYPSKGKIHTYHKDIFVQTIIILQFSKTNVEGGTGCILHPQTCGIVFIGCTDMLCCNQNCWCTGKFSLLNNHRLQVELSEHNNVGWLRVRV